MATIRTPRIDRVDTRHSLVRNRKGGTMLRADRILVGIDFSPKSNALLTSLKLLDIDKKCHISFVHVVPDLDGQVARYVKGERIGSVQKDMEGVAVKRLEELAEKKLKTGHRWDVKIGRGAPAECILRLARELRVNMIILGNSDWEKGAATRFGSTADKVVRQAPCPVLIVPLVGM